MKLLETIQTAVFGLDTDQIGTSIGMNRNEVTNLLNFMGFIDKDGTEVHDEGRPYLKSCVPGDIRWKPELLSVIQKHQTVLLKLVVKLI